jgi:hypothetical protein
LNEDDEILYINEKIESHEFDSHTEGWDLRFSIILQRKIYL